MIQIPDHSIILAPTSLHLSLYETIYAQKGNCLNIKVYSIETYLYSLFQLEKNNKIEILYRYKDALRTLDRSNTFYASRNDLFFLDACYEWIRLAHFFSVTDLPTRSRKEKELYAILKKLMEVEFPQLTPQNIDPKQIPFDQIYILKTERDLTDLIWVRYLVDHGAHLLENDEQEEKEYFALANTRKEVEWIAQAILEDKIDPTQTLITLTQDLDRHVLSQIFDAHQIPYTFLKQERISTIKNELLACFKYLYHPSKETYMQLIETLYPSASIPIRQYLERFDQVDLLKIEYEDNALISETEFLSWQNKEKEAKLWIRSHAFLNDWTLETIEAIFTHIQSLHPEPTEDDLNVFDTLLQDFIAIKASIETPEDLALFIQYIEQKNFTKIADQIQGVRIGSRHDLCALFENAIVLNAHSKTFPNLTVYHGIFDETFLSGTSFPSLKERLQLQRETIFSALGQVRHLFVLIPQSDYHGKSLESASELDHWIQKRPTFVALPDPYGGSLPTFELSQGQARSLFFANDLYSSNYSKLHTFELCPLRHYLRFGLRLKREKKEKDIHLDKNVLARILQQAKLLQNKQFKELRFEEIETLVAEQFAFALKVFPQKEQEFSILIREFATQIAALLPLLCLFEDELHLSLLNKEYEVQQRFDWNAVHVELNGSLDSYDPHSLSMIVTDPALQEAGIDDGLGGLGVFELALRQKAEPQSAYSVSYRTSQPTSEKISDRQFDQNVLENRFVQGWSAQDLPVHMKQGLLEKVAKKVPTYQEKEASMEEEVQRVVDSLSNGEILPIHEEGACLRCPYKTICRNGAIKKTKGE